MKDLLGTNCGPIRRTRGHASQPNTRSFGNAFMVQDIALTEAKLLGPPEQVYMAIARMDVAALNAQMWVRGKPHANCTRIRGARCTRD